MAYFSATGTTKGVAEKLASAVGGDLYEIVPAEPYTSADLNYSDSSTRATREQNDKSARPAIASEMLDLGGYDTIYVGYPLWWGEEPRILDTFMESYDFSGKTMIPFCTSGSSGIGSSGRNMEQLTGGATWLGGSRFGDSVSEDALRAWADELRAEAERYVGDEDGTVTIEGTELTWGAFKTMLSVNDLRQLCRDRGGRFQPL